MSSADRVVAIFCPVALLIALGVAQCGGPARAQSGDQGIGRHGDGHAEGHDWYRGLKQPGTGYSCCNGDQDGVEGDCRPTRAFLGDDGIWRALVDGKWVSVPPRVVLEQRAPDGRSHICASRSGLIYCFLAGVPKS